MKVYQFLGHDDQANAPQLSKRLATQATIDHYGFEKTGDGFDVPDVDVDGDGFTAPGYVPT